MSIEEQDGTTTGHRDPEDRDGRLSALAFTVTGYISAPVAQTFEAVADPERLSRYFTTGGAKGRLEGSTTVTWDFADFPGAFPVEVTESVANERIVIEWEGDAATIASPAGRTRVVFEFEPIDGDTRTLVTITESSWTATESGAEAAFGNCYGWSTMLACLKVWVEHGINLREGFYR